MSKIIGKSHIKKYFQDKLNKFNFYLDIPKKKHKNADLYNNLTYADLFRIWDAKHQLRFGFLQNLRKDSQYVSDMKKILIANFYKGDVEMLGKMTVNKFKKFFINQEHGEGLSDSGFYWRIYYNKVKKASINLENPKFAFTGETIDSVSVKKYRRKK